MATQVGRTPGHFIKVQMDDGNAVLRDLPVSTISGIGLTASDVDLTALQDAMEGSLPGQPGISIPLTGPVSTKTAETASATGEAPALTGSHLILSAVSNGYTPLAFGVYIGMRHNWEAGEPVFGITGTTANGVLARNYTVSDDGMYSVDIVAYPGSAVLAWGTAQLS